MPRVSILTNCLYLPTIHINLIFVTFLGKCDYTSILRNTVVKKGNLFMCSDIIIDGLYIITLDSYVVNNSVIEPTHNALSLKRKIPSTNEAYLWHLRLGHINSKSIQRLVNDGFLTLMDFQDYPVCESCLEGK
jgi:hypothetical protein